MRKSKKDRQRKDQKKKNKTTNNDVQNTTQKTQYRATRTPLKTVPAQLVEYAILFC